MAWPIKNDPTNPDATPDYDEWGVDDYWSAQDWIRWHESMKKKYGLKEANLRFVDAYGKASFGASSLDFRTFDSQFKEYAKKNGFHEALFSGIAILARPIAGAIDVGTSVIQSGEGLGQTAENIAKVMKVMLPVVVAAAAIGIIWYGYARFIKEKA